MNCREFKLLVDAVPLRLRSDRELRIARQHATRCPDCAELLAEAESLERALGSLSPVGPTNRLVANVMQRLAREAPERPTTRQPVSEARSSTFSNLEKLGWAAAVGGNLALLAVYLWSLNVSEWLRGLLTPAGFRAGRVLSVIESGSGLLIATAGALLLAAGILALPGGPGFDDRRS